MSDLPRASDDTWRPVIFDRSDGSEDAWQAFLEKHPVWQVHDTLSSQLHELVRSRNPRKNDLTAEACAPHIEALLDGVPEEHYGRWVYYPWSGRLVHLLGPDAFHELRTDRNRYKLTPEEQRQLGQLTVGIVGLSVGNVIALTLAQEGVVGHLKIADMDRLELSNLNRVRAGLHDLGQLKTVAAARQIMELDPYLRLTVVHDGVTADNLDAFLQGDDRLDVLIDECDGIRMKFQLRERARELRIPVLMETSDRGMLDVERFDLEPDRPLFHGRVGDVPSSDLVEIDSERKAVLMMKIIGPSTTSATAAASMMEIDRTTSAWPQLASDVTLGGATATMAVRRLGLGQTLRSGRLYIDLDRHLEHGGGEPAPLPGAEVPPPLPVVGMASGGGSLSGIPEHIVHVVKCAALAPSGGNCQPWQFLFDGRSIWLLHDRERSRNLLDGRHHGSWLALGAALENLRIAAEATGYLVHEEAFPVADDPTIVARVTLREGLPAGGNIRRQYAALHERVTNRRHGGSQTLSGSELLGLVDAARARGILLEVCVNPAARSEVAGILGRGDRIRVLCEQTHREMIGEMRWTQATTESTRDGIDLETLELNEFQRAAMHVLARPDVARKARQPGRGRALEEGTRDAVEASSALALISFHGEGPEAWLNAGHALQRVWLAATQARLSVHPVSALLFMFEIMVDHPDVFTSSEHEELRALRQRLMRQFPASRSRTPGFLLRLSHAPDVTARSLRLPLENVLRLGSPQ